MEHRLFNGKKLQPEDRLIIQQKEYEILKIEPDAEPAPERPFPARSFLNIDLHDHKTETISPTHYLIYYYKDTQELFLKNAKTGKTQKINEKEITLIKK
ncbi:MAG: hypothetical protein Q7R96_00900 [Nanoarchaeota archaeon]|nr:hypothetical protein [Nanoarchaeota archaeon]